MPGPTRLRHTVRRLLRSPLFSTVSVLTFALGIGANAAIFSVVNGVLLKPLPYEDADALVGLWHKAPGIGFDRLNQGPAMHFTYEEESRAFESVGMWDNESFAITGLTEPERVRGLRVTPGVFPVLRVQPFLGRSFTPEDDTDGAPETVILGHGYWRQHFAADQGVIGRTLRVDGRPREIIGVMPADFRFLDSDPAIYVPFQFDRSELFIGNFSYQGIARLKPGVTIETANADVDRMAWLAVDRFPPPEGMTRGMIENSGFGANITYLKDDVVGDVGSVLWILLGTVGVILLIACANVTNLFLVRAEGRQREVAVRSALGGGRGDIARQFIMESVTLAIIGGVAGLGLAFGGIRLLQFLAPDNLPRLGDIAIDGTVLAFTMGLSLVVGLVFGLFPVFHSGRPDLVSALKEGGRGSSDGRGRYRLRDLLAVSQVALATLLLVGSGLLVRSFQSLRQVEPGFEAPESVMTFRVAMPSSEIEEADAVLNAHQELQRQLAALPGVTSVGASTSITMDGWNSSDPIFVEEFPVDPDVIPPLRRFKWVTGEYFATMGNPLLAGRTLTWNDVYQRARVAVISRALAMEYWDEPAQAIGKRIRPTPSAPWREIVGVVGDVRDDGLTADVTPVVFWPIATEHFWFPGDNVQRTLAYAVRTQAPNPTSVMPAVRKIVAGVNPNLTMASVYTLEEILDRSLARTAFALVMLAIAAAVALVLGAVGIYGVLSYSVSLRVREIGVRMAVGARALDVIRMVVGRGGAVAAVGIVLGLGAAMALTRLMASLLFGVSPVDATTYGAVSVVIALVVVLASYLPARRAAAIDPLEALRSE